MIIQNQWKELDSQAGELPPGARVTVVIPAHCAQETLDLCVAALAEQDIDSANMEVVVVDHRSEPPLTCPQTTLDLSLHRLETGHGPGAARAFGASQATGSVLVFVDVDVFAMPDMVREYAAMPAHDPSVLTLGFREFVDPARTSRSGLLKAISAHALGDYIRSRKAPEAQEWIDTFLAKVDDGMMWRDDLWAIVVGAGIGISRQLYDLMGGFRDYPVHGVEDIEFGWRAFQAGAVIAPNRRAVGVHWGLRSISRNRDEINRRRAGHLANLIPHVRYRSAGVKRQWQVPRVLVHVVTDSQTTADDLVATCHDLLAAREPDLRIEIVAGASADVIELANSWLSSESRVSVIEPEEVGVPEGVPFLLRTMSGVRFGQDAVPKMVRALKEGRIGLTCVVAGADLVTAELWRTCALARVQFFSPPGADSRQLLRDCFGEVWLAGADAEVSRGVPGQVA